MTLAIGDRVRIPPGIPCDKRYRISTGVGVVESFTKTGRVKVRWQNEQRSQPKRFYLPKNLELVQSAEAAAAEALDRVHQGEGEPKL